MNFDQFPGQNRVNFQVSCYNILEAINFVSNQIVSKHSINCPKSFKNLYPLITITLLKMQLQMKNIGFFKNAIILCNFHSSSRQIFERINHCKLGCPLFEYLFELFITRRMLRYAPRRVVMKKYF
jgi:hypothetical protein